MIVRRNHIPQAGTHTLPFADVRVLSFSIRDIHMTNSFSSCSSRQRPASHQPTATKHNSPAAGKHGSGCCFFPQMCQVSHYKAC